MAYFEPASCIVDVEKGVLRNESSRYEKRLRDLAELYADSAAFAEAARSSGDAIVYEVTEFRPTEKAGDMILGVTRMAPGRIGSELYMTRGHIHANADRPEIYYGQKGEGLMLMESPEGEIRIVEIRPQTICYVPPYWIHRSVNTGTGDFVTVFAYPADSGQDYSIIARSNGMRSRIMDDGAGGWKEVANPEYRPRSPDEIAAVLRSSAETA